MSEHVHYVAIAFKMTEWVEQWVCIKFCVKLECSSMETICNESEDCGYGQLVIGSLVIDQDNAPTHASHLLQFFRETSNHPSDSAPLQPTFGALRLLAFPQTKITLEREEISDHRWNSGKYNGAADGDGTEESLFYVQCFLHLVSSSINVFIFHITWLDTFIFSTLCMYH